MIALALVVVIVGMGATNTFAGGRFIEDEKLPGRNLYFATPLVFLITWTVEPWLVALAWATAFILWRTWAWGHLIGLGRFRPSNRPPGPIEALCLRVAGGQPHIAMFVRELFILPGLLLVTTAKAWALPAGLEAAWWIVFLTVPYAVAAVIAREIGWRLPDKNYAIMYGEIFEGLVWGVLIVSVSAAVTGG